MAFDTGSPIGSTDARDLYDNAQNLDYAVNQSADRWTDRLGVSRPSWAGMVAYADRGAYAAGIVITGYNEMFLFDGEYYRAAAATTLPYTTTGSWSDDGVDFVSIGDANLRSELSAGTTGAINGMINVAYFGTLEEARTNSEAAGRTIVVDNVLTEAQSNITAAWPSDRALKVEKGGEINNSTAFPFADGASFTVGDYLAFSGIGAVTGLKEARPEWFNDGVVGDSEAIQKAFIASKRVVANGQYSISSTITWPSSFGWELVGRRGITTFTATADIVMLGPPGTSADGQYGTISGITFKSETIGIGTAIGKEDGTYIAHCIIEKCDFEHSLRYGFNAVILGCDIRNNVFGFPLGVHSGLFQPIRAIGETDLMPYATNINRLTSNEFVGAKGAYVIDIQGGYHTVMEGNIFEANFTTSGLIHMQNYDNFYYLHNWSEGNGNIPLVVFENGPTLNNIINVFDGNIIDARDQTYIIDISAASVRRLVLKNNTISAQTHIVKSSVAPTYDDLGVFVEWGNNFITGDASPITPTSSTKDWGKAGSGLIGGSLSIEGTLTSAKIRTTSAPVSVPTATATAIFTAAYVNGAPPVYLITACLLNVGVGYQAYALVINDGTGPKILASTVGANITLTISGDSLMYRQTSGATQQVYVTALKMN